MLSWSPERSRDTAGAEMVTARQLSARERAPLWSLRLHTRESLSRSFVFVPSIYLLGAVALGIALPAIDRARTGGSVLGVTTTGAQSILESVAAGMIAFSGLVVSVAVLVVQFGAGQYSPRLVQSFRRDSAIKNAVGLFVAPGVYALVAVGNIGGSTRDRVGALTVSVALALMVAALVALFGFIGRLLDLMRPRRIYSRLLRSFVAAIQQVYPQPAIDDVELRPIARLPVSASFSHRHRDEVLVGVDRARLVRAARRADVTIELTSPIGSHVRHDAPILLIRGGSAIDDRVLRRALTFADGRRVTQDPSFAIRCIVDVAVRALSPAVNDPTSAVEGLDALEAALMHLGQRPIVGSAILDDEDTIRLLLPSPAWGDLVELALTEVRSYGASSPQVARRLTAVLDHLTHSLEPDRQAAVARQREALDRSLTRIYQDPDELAFVTTADSMGIGGAPPAARRAAEPERTIDSEES